MSSRAEQARRNFRQGYNCCQSVLLAFIEDLGLERKALARLGASFGGGIGRMRETCGAVSAMAMVLGLLEGYDQPQDQAGKAALYQRVQALAAQFREEAGSLLCRELLAGVQTAPGPLPEARTEAYYQRRPCENYIALAARLLEQELGLS